MDPDSSVSTILLVFFLIALNGIFVAFEFALIKVRAEDINEGKSKFNFGLKRSQEIQNRAEFYVAVAQLGITASCIMLGWIGLERLVSCITLLIPTATPLLVQAFAFVFIFIGLVILQVIFGELIAKAIGVRYSVRTVTFLAPFMFVVGKMCTPFVYVIEKSAALFLRLLGLESPSQMERIHTVEELSNMVTKSSAHGELDRQEEEMLQGIFSFSETLTREVMTPRTNLYTVQINSNLDEVLEKIAVSGYSRLPVIGETIDDVRGILVVKDIFSKLPTYMAGAKVDFSLQAIVREPLFVPGTKKIDSLLREFKKHKQHMAIVLDEHGGVDGVITLEDVLEEIVGDIFDESDTAEREIVVRKDGDIVVDGRVLVEELNDQFPLSLPEGEYDTIAGLVLTQLGRVPKEGEVVLLNELASNGLEPNPNAENTNGHLPLPVRLTVKKLIGHRIRQVEISFNPEITKESKLSVRAS